MTGLVYFIFFISGISGLAYQVIWVREFGQIFGNTVQSASLVSGTFVLGLGVGSWLAGRIIDRKNEADGRAGLAWYAYAELLIALLGLAIAFLTVRLEALSPFISSYAKGDNGWFELTATSWLLRYLVAVALVGPITIVMGATLTFLIRFVLSRSVEQAGWKIGLLYGMNTLGAALGCALVDLWAVPAIGLMQTKMIAVALNVVAGLSALYLLKTVPIASARPAAGKVAATEPNAGKTAATEPNAGKTEATKPNAGRAAATEPVFDGSGKAIETGSPLPAGGERVRVRGPSAAPKSKRSETRARTASRKSIETASPLPAAGKAPGPASPLPAVAKAPGPASPLPASGERDRVRGLGTGSATGSASRRALLCAGLAIAISGFCAMGMEIVWFRFLSSVYSLSRYVFSLLLVTILVGMWTGSLLSGYLSRKYGNPERLYIYSQLLFSSCVLLCLFLFFESDRKLLINVFRDTFFGPQPMAQDTLLFKLFDYSVIVYPALMTLFVPAVLMGFAFPMINAMLQKDTASVGAKAGQVYLWNAIGAVLGSLATGFVLLPTIGMQNSVTILAIGAALAIVPILLMRQADTSVTTTAPAGFRLSLPTASLGAVLVLLTGMWITRPADYVVRNSFLDDQRKLVNQSWLKISEGINEVAIVIEGHQGDRDRRLAWRQLFTNGHSMAGTDYSSIRYMSSFVHIPLLQMDDPRSVLVICFGVGNTSHAASLYPTVSRLDIVDLSKNVLGLASWFSRWNKDVLKDPRANVFVNDGRQHLRMQPEGSYDLVTLEPPPLNHAGVASLYSEEFYRLVHRSLRKGGYMTQWLPVYQVAEEHNRRLVKSFLNVFPNAVLLNGSNQEFMLVGQKDGPNQIDWRAFQKRLDANPRVKDALRNVDLIDPVEWLGTFTASSSWLTQNFARTLPMTDDDPIIEDNHFLQYKFIPKELFNTARFAEWCPTCFVEGKLVPELRPLAYYLGILQNVYTNRAFLRDGPFIPDRKTYRIALSRTDNSAVVPDANRLLQSPTQDQFREMLGRYRYFQVFGPDWAFEY